LAKYYLAGSSVHQIIIASKFNTAVLNCRDEIIHVHNEIKL